MFTPNGSFRLLGISSRICGSMSQNYKTLPRHTAVLNDDVHASLDSSEIRHKHHPGIRNLKCVQLPSRLVKAVDTVVKNSGQELSQLLVESQEFSEELWKRHLPVEPHEQRAKQKEYETDAEIRYGVNLEVLSEEERTKVESRKRSMVFKRMAELTKRWKPISYDSHYSLLYMIARIGKDYAVLQQVFSELQNGVPAFAPKTLLDFGSGVGSVTWAASDFWKDSLKEYFSVDISSDMNTLSRILLQGGKEDAEPFLKGLYFRQYLPMSNLIKYDLVVSAFSLQELPSLKDRLETVETLWQKTQDTLVLIENGNMAGFTALVQARDYILNVFDVAYDQSSEVAHVVAPCPHDRSCPRFGEQGPIPCSFNVSYQPLPLFKKPPKRAKFSYVVLRKGKRDNTSPLWPRIVRPVLRRPRHVICRLCSSDGQLKEVVFTKAKHGRHAYRCARVSEWGDLLPVEVKKLEKRKETNEELEPFDELNPD